MAQLGGKSSVWEAPPRNAREAPPRKGIVRAGRHGRFNIKKFGKNDSKNSTNCKISLRKNLKIEFPIETRYIKKIFLNLNKTEIRPKSKNDLLLL